MGLKEFQDLLDRYGGDPKAWPADRRAEALALAGASAEAGRLLEETQYLERLLADPAVPEPSLDAMDRVMARISAHEERLARVVSPTPMPALARARALAGEVNGILGGLVYHPAILLATVSLIGILVGVADRASSLHDAQSGLIYFIATL
ncbi:MAG: hypothetical protein IH626_10895 [Rhodospirillales bacterium]|nr:hypothetical protein [Rhodospirillales bacterium]